eukprot:CAMPEP_0182591892 /NCGR_PEP_ID=MMETSP1324-20130603/74796_1 /TAXON_ID=236786 /ORGANISM="Florenciella sp., Strain RCC1587" /LENGTH=244 /DNA_ID=CAMNT_0024809239 /DNA_START=1 /DNA_END=731 /DNA_ORIENTATION=+
MGRIKRARVIRRQARLSGVPLATRSTTAICVAGLCLVGLALQTRLTFPGSSSLDDGESIVATPPGLAAGLDGLVRNAPRVKSAAVTHSVGVYAQRRSLSEGEDGDQTDPGTRVLDMFLAIIGSVTVFCALAIVCDDYLCPAIEEICERLQIPDDVAGATLLALGSSAPEIIVNVAATVSGKIDLGLPAVLGSGLLAFGFIPSLCAFVSPAASHSKFTEWNAPLMTLSTGPVLRDAVFYIFITSV